MKQLLGGKLSQRNYKRSSWRDLRYAQSAEQYGATMSSHRIKQQSHVAIK